MSKKRIFTLCLGTAVAWGVGVGISRLIPAARATAPPAAFTVEYLTTSHNEAGMELQHAVATFAQRPDGSSVLLQKTAGPNQPSGTRRILDAGRNRLVSVDPFTKSVSTYRYDDRELEQARNPAASCEERTNLGRDGEPQPKIFGFDVIRFSGKMTATQNPVSRWLAPALNCFVLQEQGTIADEKIRFQRVTTSVSLGEPDPALFEIPNDYTERPPSEVLALAREKLGLPASRHSGHAERSLDGVYQSRRAR